MQLNSVDENIQITKMLRYYNLHTNITTLAVVFSIFYMTICGRVPPRRASFTSSQWPHSGEDTITMGEEGSPSCFGREKFCL